MPYIGRITEKHNSGLNVLALPMTSTLFLFWNQGYKNQDLKYQPKDSNLYKSTVQKLHVCVANSVVEPYRPLQ